jgi:hypothetical protein
MSLQIGLCRRAAHHQRVSVDEGQILPLLVGEAPRCSGVTQFEDVIHVLRPQPHGAAMNIRHRVTLSQTEREPLTALLSGGKHPSRKLKRAQILLAADADITDDAIAATLSVSGSTVYRTKRRFVEGNLELALAEEARPGRRAQADRPRGGAAGRHCVL